MSFKVHRRISKEQLLKVVPKGLRQFADGIVLEETFALAVFTGRPARIGEVRRALKRMHPLNDERLILAGIDFTAEALALAESKGAHVIAERFRGWTEARYEEIRTIMATGKKRPLP